MIFSRILAFFKYAYIINNIKMMEDPFEFNSIRDYQPYDTVNHSTDLVSNYFASGCDTLTLWSYQVFFFPISAKSNSSSSTLTGTSKA